MYHFLTLHQERIPGCLDNFKTLTDFMGRFEVFTNIYYLVLDLHKKEIFVRLCNENRNAIWFLSCILMCITRTCFFLKSYIYYVISIAVMLGEQENKQKRPVNLFLGL